jgi:arylsulfatase A-like enzyme
LAGAFSVTPTLDSTGRQAEGYTAMTLKHPWRGCLAFCLATVAIATAPAAPNVIVILADDMGWADLGRDGSKIQTPNLDRLAQQGVKLTRFYASAPMCSPTRAALLTGRYPHSVGMPELASPLQRGVIPPLNLDPAAITIPEALQPAGYRSLVVGKWHLGFAAKSGPRHHGFDEFWGSLIGTPQYWQVKETYHDDTPMTLSGRQHFTDMITDKAVEYLRRDARADRPLFLYLAYNAPHYPMEAPAELVNKYLRIFPDRGMFAVYAAMVDQLDQSVGRVLAALDELKIADNTLVIFMSDNGPSAEPNTYGLRGADYSNGPFRGTKFHTHEGGIRVPFIARWPGKLPAGAVRDTPAITMDILPTLLDAAQIKPAAAQEIHGVSILPLLRGESFARPGMLHWETRQNSAVLAGEWKLVHRSYEKPRLYRLAEDPGESRDLASQHPEKVAELLAAHERWATRHYPNRLPRETVRQAYFFPVTAEDP